MTKKFMVSVADVRIYDISNDNLLAVGKTLVDSSIDVTLGNTDIRGGRGNQLQSVYYHTAAMEIKVTETQFNLDFLALTVGKTVASNTNVYTEETITLGAAGTGTVLGTPLAVATAVIYGWVTQVDGTVEKVTFSGSTFATSSGTSGDVVCVRYYNANSSARYLTIDADILPKIVRVEMETLLISSESTTSRIGVVQIIVPSAQLSGSFSLAMTSDGVSTTPLSLRALASQDLTTAACSNVPVLAKVVEILDAAVWSDNIVALAIQGGDITALPFASTRQLVVWAIPSSGSSFVVPLTGTNITFSSSVAGTATVSANGGLVSGVAVNSSTPTIIHAYITSKPTIDASISVVCV
jgi:hypothetical protein